MAANIVKNTPCHPFGVAQVGGARAEQAADGLFIVAANEVEHSELPIGDCRLPINEAWPRIVPPSIGKRQSLIRKLQHDLIQRIFYNALRPSGFETGNDLTHRLLFDDGIDRDPFAIGQRRNGRILQRRQQA